MNLRLPTVLVLFQSFALLAAAAEPPSGATAPVKQASFDRSVPQGTTPQTARFGRRAALVGDQVEQTMALEMRLKLTMRREAELIGTNQTTVRTNQKRIVTTTAVERGNTMAVRVEYPQAIKQVVAAEAPTTPPAANGASGSDVTAQYQPVSQPVEGKTYLCRREPGENGKLIVTDEAGNPPPTDELDIVAPQMDMVGRSNPLAEFLAGRTVAVGDKLELPRDLASKVFNLGDKFGKVTHFTLTLQNVSVENGVQCAEFSANVEAASSGVSQMLLQVQGSMTVQADTCRAVRVDVNGPIGMSESRGSFSTAYQVIGTGHLQTTIAAAYREAQIK